MEISSLRPDSLQGAEVSERTCFICGTYVYWGMLTKRVELGDEGIHLADCYIIYDTGKWSDPEWKIAEYLGNWSIAKSAVESWGVINKRLPAGAISAATPGKTTTADQSQSLSGGSLRAGGADEWEGPF